MAENQGISEEFLKISIAIHAQKRYDYMQVVEKSGV